MTQYKDNIETDICSDLVSDKQLSIYFDSEPPINPTKDLNVLSLFSGCGGMDLGFEGNFITHRKSTNTISDFVKSAINEHWVIPKDP